MTTTTISDHAELLLDLALLRAYAEIVSREVARLDATDLLPIPADLLRWHFERGVPALQAAADIAQFTS